MSERTLVGVVITAALLAAAPSTGAAAVVTYTFAGVADGYGGAGEKFGFAGQSFTDQAFTLSFRRDDAAPGTSFYSSAGYSEVAGNHAIVPVTATLVFNGATIDFGLRGGGQNQTDGATEGFQLYASDGFVEQVSPGVNRSVGHLVSIRGSGAGSNYLPSSDYHSLPTLTPATTPLWTWFGRAEFSEATYNSATGAVFSSKDNGKIYFRPLSMTIQTSAVPEPGTWAMMILGFGAAGTALRRRRRLGVSPPGISGIAAVAAAVAFASPASAAVEVKYYDSSGGVGATVGDARSDAIYAELAVNDPTRAYETSLYADLASGQLGAYASKAGFGVVDATATLQELLTFQVAGASASTLTPITFGFSLDGTYTGNISLIAGWVFQANNHWGDEARVTLSQGANGDFVSTPLNRCAANSNPLDFFGTCTVYIKGAQSTVGILNSLRVIAQYGTAANPSLIDYSNTAKLSMVVPDNVTWTSQSGKFLSAVSAVPEPATWAMMIAGFGAVGSMARASRRRNAHRAA